MADPWFDYDVGAGDEFEEMLAADDMDLLGFDSDELLGIDPETAAMLGLSFGDIWGGVKKVASAARKVLPIAAAVNPMAALQPLIAQRGGTAVARSIGRHLAQKYGTPHRSRRRTDYARRLSGGQYGAPPAGAKEWPLPFPLVTFTDTTPTTQNTIARPQRLFRGRRLFVNVVRSAGATGVAVSITRFDVGADNQLASAGALAAEFYGPQAFDSRLVTTPSGPGIDITLGFSVTPTPAVGESVIVQATIHGDSWGS